MSYSLTTKASWSQTSQELEEAFRKWGVANWETNYPRGARLTGMYQTEEDRLVTLKWTAKDGRQVELSMNKQNRAVDNLRVLYLAVEAMRLNEARGIGEVMASAYKQLGGGPGGEGGAGFAIDIKKSPWDILEISPNASLQVAEAAYRAKARLLHPDTGGYEGAMKDLNQAVEFIRKEQNG